MLGTALGTGALDGVIPLQEGALAAIGLLFVLVPLVVVLVVIAGMWKVFEKAGQPGWAAVIPIYNVYILVAKVAGRDVVWVVLSILIPFVVVIPLIDVAKAFGKGAGYGVGLWLLGFIFFPLLGFGDAQYQGAPN